MKTKIILYGCLFLFVVSCKKESENASPDTTQDVNPNTALIKSNSSEYIIADIEGVTGLTKVDLQNGDNVPFVRHFNQCPVTQPFTLLEVNKPAQTNTINFVFFSSQMCTSFKEPLQTGSYRTYGNEQGSVTMSYCNNTLPNTCASMVPASHWGESGDYFKITEFKTIGGIEFAIGEFSVSFAYGTRYEQKLWLKNGIFKIRVN